MLAGHRIDVSTRQVSFPQSRHVVAWRCRPWKPHEDMTKLSQRPNLAALLAGIALLAGTDLTVADTVAERTIVVAGHEAPLQWTPLTTTVIKGEEIESTYRRDLEDLEGLAPGLIIDGLSGTPRGAAISMRGIGSDQVSSAFEPAVALSIDGVYVGTHSGRMQTLFDFEHVDITRGPNATLDPAPNLGGSINLVRRKPTGELGGEARASFGDYDRGEFDAILNFPLGTTLSGKLSLSWLDGGGAYMTNNFMNRAENQEDRTAVALSLLWQPTSASQLLYIYDTVDDNADTPALLNLSSTSDLVCSASMDNASCAAGGGFPQTRDISRTAQNFSNARTYDGDHHTLQFDFAYADFDISLVTGLRNTTEATHQDLDATHTDLYSVTRRQTYRQISQEITFRRDEERLHYAFGLYYLNTDYDVRQEAFYILNTLNDNNLTCCFLDNDVRLLESGQEGQLQSAFAHGTYTLTDQWTIDAGVRYGKYRKQFRHAPFAVVSENVTIPSTLIAGERAWQETAPTVGISYRVDDEAMVYVRYATGYLPGIFDEDAQSIEAARPAASQSTKSLELGLKSEWYEDRLRINLAVFRVDLSDGVDRFAQVGASGRVEMQRDNIYDLESRGYELEFEVTPLTNLKIMGAFSHLNTGFSRFSIPDLTMPGQFQDLRDLIPARSPAESLYISAHYAMPLWRGTLRTHAGFRLSDSYWTNPRATLGRVNNWDTTDLSVEFEWNDWTFRLFSQNLQDKRYITNPRRLTVADVVTLDGSTTSVPGIVTYGEMSQPRYTGFEFIYRPDLTSLAGSR